MLSDIHLSGNTIIVKFSHYKSRDHMLKIIGKFQIKN